jgi:hypothetical protein
MKYITSEEINEWSRKLEPIGYWLRDEGNNLITVNTTQKSYSMPGSMYSMEEMSNSPYDDLSKLISHNFSFSICENVVEEFKDIFNEISDRDIKNVFRSSNNNDKKNHFIKPSKNYKLKTINHKVRNKNYVRFDYVFSDSILPILIKISYIKDSISILKKIWDYDEKGEEILNIKHKKGDVISLSEDPSGDYIIICYYYEQDIQNANNYNINYGYSKIENVKGVAIEYSEICYTNGENIINNRSDRLSSLLT